MIGTMIPVQLLFVLILLFDLTSYNKATLNLLWDDFIIEF